MKNFKYTGRDKNGSLLNGVIHAKDRKAVLSVLLDKGIHPVSVSEKSGTATNGKIPAALTKRASLLAVLGLLTAILIGLWRYPAQNREPKRRSEIVGKAKDTPQNKAVRRPEQPQKIRQQDIAEDRAEVSVSQTIEATEHRATAPVAKPLPVSMGKRHSDGEKIGVATNRAFKGMTEQSLAMIASVPPGMRVPPIPLREGMSEDFLKAISNTIVIEETDSDSTATHKEEVAWLKLDIANLVKEGLSPEEAIQKIEAVRKEQATLRQMTVNHIMELRNNGQHSEADALITEANAYFQAEGILPLSENLGKNKKE